MAPAGADVKINAILMRAIRVAPVRGLIRVIKTQAARVPPPVRPPSAAASIITGLAAVPGPAPAKVVPAARARAPSFADGVDAKDEPVQVAFKVLNGLASRPVQGGAVAELGAVAVGRGGRKASPALCIAARVLCKNIAAAAVARRRVIILLSPKMVTVQVPTPVPAEVVMARSIKPVAGPSCTPKVRAPITTRKRRPRDVPVRAGLKVA